jgi:alkanesulfonate monooxygenase SsuD/methylene tetrahydromethanopterin reductase-like flavin-dependent oxidoreductase (luciferase family)
MHSSVRVLWRDDEATFDGVYYDFARVCSFPKPVNGSIPIHIGGHSEAAAKRAGARGDGFQPLGIAGDALVDALATMRRAADDAGRDVDAIELTVSGGLTTTLTDDDVAAAEKVGAARMLMSTRVSDLSEVIDQLSTFSERFL